MATLVVGDVHGCARELGLLLDEVQPDRVVLVGDVFTKGPKPLGVWKLIEGHKIEAVLGNHDERLLATIEGRTKGDRAARSIVEELDEGAPGWREWTRALPLFLEVDGWTVVHAGLHPSGSLDQTTKNMALTMRRFPTDRTYSPFWHAIYKGDRRVVFGHDARRGLVRVERDGEPLLIGLDTGCVYGGQLSGYVIQRDEIVSVKAKKTYRQV